MGEATRILSHYRSSHYPKYDLLNREEELDTLTGAVESPDSDLVVVYGRRRVGKTELPKEFCADRPHIYFLAAQEAEHRQREKFLDQVADYFDERVPRIDSWDEAFEYLGEQLQREDLDVIIDEFPYLVAENDSLPSYVQGFVDQELDGTDSMLVFCGSSVSTMESEILGQGSPLYGQRTAQLGDSWSLFNVTGIGDLLTPS